MANQPLRIHRIGAVRACPARKSAANRCHFVCPHKIQNCFKMRFRIGKSAPVYTCLLTPCSDFSQRHEPPIWGPFLSYCLHRSAFIKPCRFLLAVPVTVPGGLPVTTSCLGHSIGHIESASPGRGTHSTQRRRPAHPSWS